MIDVRPIGAADGSEGYEVESVRSGAWLRKERRVQRAHGVVNVDGTYSTALALQPARITGRRIRFGSFTIIRIASAREGGFSFIFLRRYNSFRVFRKSR